MVAESQVGREQVASDGRPGGVYLTAVFMVLIGIYSVWYGKGLFEVTTTFFQYLGGEQIWLVNAVLLLALGAMMFVSAGLLFTGKPWTWDLAVIILAVDGVRNLYFGLISEGHTLLPLMTDNQVPAETGILILVLQGVALLGLFVNKEYFNAPYTDYLKSKLEQ